MIRRLQDTVLCERMINFVLLDDNFLPQDFDGVEEFGFLVTTKNDLPKCSLSQQFEKFEILKSLQRKLN